MHNNLNINIGNSNSTQPFAECFSHYLSSGYTVFSCDEL